MPDAQRQAEREHDDRRVHAISVPCGVLEAEARTASQAPVTDRETSAPPPSARARFRQQLTGERGRAPAPSACRVASSFIRALDRTSMRLVTLTPPTSSTNTTPPHSR